MKNRIVALSAVFLLACAGHAVAQEHLVVPPYPAAKPWKNITDKANDRQTLKEWIPADQSAIDIRDILNAQSFPELKGRDPAAFVKDILQRVGGVCGYARVNGPKAGTENGYAVAYGQAYCTNEKGASQDVDIFIKAISGKDAMYVVQREFHRPTGPNSSPGIATFTKDQTGEMKARMEAQSAADKFLLSQVKLCADAVCGAGGAASGTKDETLGTGWPVEGKTTAKEVRAKLGTPVAEDRSDPRHDGEYVLLYDGKDGRKYGFLFGKNNVLEHLRIYARTP
jgi:hypothetical protein